MGLTKKLLMRWAFKTPTERYLFEEVLRQARVGWRQFYTYPEQFGKSKTVPGFTHDAECADFAERHRRSIKAVMTDEAEAETPAAMGRFALWFVAERVLQFKLDNGVYV